MALLIVEKEITFIMPAHPRTKDFPEALVKILLTLMEKAPGGGATMEDLKDAYRESRGTTPSNKTIQRSIRRLNLIFNPLAYGETLEEGEEVEEEGDIYDDEYGKESYVSIIQTKRKKGVTYYIFTGKFPTNNLDASHALLLTLGLYTQQHGFLKGYYETVIREILRDLLNKITTYNSIFSELEKHIHVSGYGPLDPGNNLEKIKGIMRSIRHRKRINLEYKRTYDGTLTKREVEPYGLVCRFNNWYLIANCLQQHKRRVFLLDHIQHLRVQEASTFKWPEGFSLHDTYGSAWGVWTTDEEPPKKETIRLKVAKGPAERFQMVCFHDSQKVTILPSGEAEVTFEVTGASEMIPWLMSWGAAVEVMEPHWLRKALVSHFEEMLRLYKKLN